VFIIFVCIGCVLTSINVAELNWVI